MCVCEIAQDSSAMATENRSTRPTWLPEWTLERPNQVEDVTDVTDRLCTNLVLRVNNFLHTHSKEALAKPDPDYVHARHQEALDAVSDVKALMYKLISEKRALESDYYVEKKRRLELERSVRSLKKG